MTSSSLSPARSIRAGMPVVFLLALLGSAAASHAAVVVRDINVTLTATDIATYRLDLDQNGSTDFTFTAAFVADPFFPVGFDTIDVPFASSNAFVVDSTTPNGFPTISRLAPGAMVSGASLFSFLGDQGNLAYSIPFDPASGNFLGQTGYVGLRLVEGDGTFYGYAQVTVAAQGANNAFDLTIGSVGFENVAGRAIAIPAVNGVPEPGSLALVAMAGLGLVLTRRRAGSVPTA